MDKILISIKPNYIEKILAGSKIIELRKRLGKHFIPDNEIYLYSSSPVKALVGKTIIKKVVSKELSSLYHCKNEILKDACITETDFDEYFGNSMFCHLIYLGKVTLIQKPLDIQFLRSVGISPPQSFCYLQKNVLNLIDSRGFKK